MALESSATNWCVYMHENRVNGKKYIGITCQKPTRRWKNGQGYDHCPLFYAAILKYGWDAFRHDILFTELTQEEAERLEAGLIAKYQTQDREKGYNLDPGGGVRHPTEETRKKLSEALRGRSFGDEHRRKLSEAAKRHPSNTLGKTQTAEHRRRISEAKMGHPVTEETRAKLRGISKGGNSTSAKAVICVETEVVYPSISDAVAATGTSESSIIRCCKGQRKTAGGYRWKYAEAVSADA